MNLSDSYKSWIEKKPDAYLGLYSLFDFSESKDNSYIVQDLILSKENDSLKVVLRKYSNTENPVNFDSTAIINSVIHEGCLMTLDQSIIFLQESKGAFVYKFPPANAKGKVLKGLLLGNVFFEKIE